MDMSMCDHPPIEKSTKRQMEGSEKLGWKSQGLCPGSKEKSGIVSVHQSVLKKKVFFKNEQKPLILFSSWNKNNPYLFNYINAKIIIESVYILKHKLYLIENVS